VVLPYYLKMMGLNSLRESDALIAEVAGVAHTVTPDDAVRLLRIAWRERVMGAWYSILVTEPPVPTEVLHALEISHGTLDAPCLTAAAISIVGPEAMPSIVTYHGRAVEHRYGGEGVIQAAASFLQTNHGVRNPLPEPTVQDNDDFTRLMGVAAALRRHFGE
jgi:hypothetical protein